MLQHIVFNLRVGCLILKIRHIHIFQRELNPNLFRVDLTLGKQDNRFNGLLSKKAGYYIPPERLSSFDAIDFLQSVGAVPVLAHPFLNLKTEKALRHFLAEAVSHGLAAMETIYSSYSPETEALARHIALEFGLKESGGSDFHGQTKPHIALGSGKGNLAVPAVFAKALKNSI